MAQALIAERERNVKRTSPRLRGIAAGDPAAAGSLQRPRPSAAPARRARQRAAPPLPPTAPAISITYEAMIVAAFTIDCSFLMSIAARHLALVFAFDSPPVISAWQ